MLLSYKGKLLYLNKLIKNLRMLKVKNLKQVLKHSNRKAETLQGYLVNDIKLLQL